jgi:hypothetical protein
MKTGKVKNLYSLMKYYVSDNIKEEEPRGACGMSGGRVNGCRVLVGKPEGKRPLGVPRCRWENNIKMDLKEIEWEHVDWLYLAEDRDKWQPVVNMVMNYQIP